MSGEMSTTQATPHQGPAATSSPRRPEFARQASWQPLDTMTQTHEFGTTLTTTPSKPADENFESDLDQHPEDHFLSPIQMYEFESWSEDSDDDGEEVEWDAGITDFALFDSDRRAAQDAEQPLPNKWHGWLENQTSALERAVQRTKGTSEHQIEPEFISRIPSDENMSLPSLTPDGSPNLRDDLEVESFRTQATPRTIVPVPNYLTITVTPPESSSSHQQRTSYNNSGLGSAIAEEDEEEDDQPLTFFVQRSKHKRSNSVRLTPIQRPGLRYSRTMSGKPHVWRRPSWDIYPLREDVAAEMKAEEMPVECDDCDEEREGRGRRR